MEPQVNVNCRRENNRNCCCGDLILGIIIVLTAFVLGVILGATVLAGVIVANLVAIIVLLTVLVILLIIRLIMIFCNETRRCC